MGMPTTGRLGDVVRQFWIVLVVLDGFCFEIAEGNNTWFFRVQVMVTAGGSATI
jgi:hypothetical protein